MCDSTGNHRLGVVMTHVRPTREVLGDERTLRRLVTDVLDDHVRHHQVDRRGSPRQRSPIAHDHRPRRHAAVDVERSDDRRPLGERVVDDPLVLVVGAHPAGADDGDRLGTPALEEPGEELRLALPAVDAERDDTRAASARAWEATLPSAPTPAGQANRSLKRVGVQPPDGRPLSA